MTRKAHGITAELGKIAASLPKLIAAADARSLAIVDRMAALEEAGLIYATEHWRRARKTGEPAYLYLLHPSHAGELRRREYVGRDEQRIESAREGIQRAKEFDVLAEQHQYLQAQLEEACDTLRRAKRLLNQSW